MKRRSFLARLSLVPAAFFGRPVRAAEPVMGRTLGEATTRVASGGGAVRLCVPLAPAASGHGKASVPAWTGGVGGVDLVREPLQGSAMLPSAWPEVADRPRMIGLL